MPQGVRTSDITIKLPTEFTTTTTVTGNTATTTGQAYGQETPSTRSKVDMQAILSDLRAERTVWEGMVRGDDRGSDTRHRT